MISEDLKCFTSNRVTDPPVHRVPVCSAAPFHENQHSLKVEDKHAMSGYILKMKVPPFGLGPNTILDYFA